MCGICGIYSKKIDFQDIQYLQKMNGALKHRGPDDEGYVLINTSGETRPLKGDDTIQELSNLDHISEMNSLNKFHLCMGHRRLSIIDVSARGHQPMVDAESGSWIVFNGEIYNYVEIRSDLIQKGHSFRTLTDTEVILKAHQQWGVDCLSNFNGMWAFTIWDNSRKMLFCSRDRFGVKPFYYFLDKGKFIFSSEIKSILKHKGIVKRTNPRIIWDYLFLTLIDHTEETFFDNIMQLLPGHFLTIDTTGNINVKQYYKLNYKNEIGSKSTKELEQLSRNFSETLENAVKIRLRSDVPVGSYLSGGIDSSSILCMVERFLYQLPYGFKTFSAVYNDSRFDERKFIQEAIKGKDIESFFYQPQQQVFYKDINDLIYYQDEPFISTAIYAQWSLLSSIKEHRMKVLLTGDGADEILCGYPYPYIALYLLDLIKENKLLHYMRELKSFGYYQGFVNTLKGIYWLLPSTLRIPIRNRFRIKPKIINRQFLHEFLWREKMWMDMLFRTSLQERLYLDMTRFLLPHALRFREKNAMAFSIEERQPFLDYRLVELCFMAPAIYKIYLGWRKYLLRVAMDNVISSSIQWRKTKLGFGTFELRWFLEFIDLFGRNNYRGCNYIDYEKLFSYSKKVSMDNPEEIIELWSFYNLELWMRVFEI